MANEGRTGATLTSAVGLSWLVITGLGLIDPKRWAFVFAVVVSYVILDLSSGNLIRKIRVGRESYRISLVGMRSRFQPKGYVFLVFLFGEILAISVGISYFADALGTRLSQNPDPVIVVAFSTIAIALVAFLMWYRIYRKQ